jgi:hypothetical protein
MLKKDSKGNLAEVNPLRTRKDSIYHKGTNNIFRISRSKLSSFIDCHRCFYLDITQIRINLINNKIYFRA